MRSIFTALCFVALAEGFSRCDPEFWWIWRIVTAVTMALLAIAWKLEAK